MSYIFLPTVFFKAVFFCRLKVIVYICNRKQQTFTNILKQQQQ